MPSSLSHIRAISQAMHNHLRDDVLSRWYPFVIDKKHGGYFTNLSYNWRLSPEQDKMIVSQARHVWTTSKAAMFEPGHSSYTAYALHGLQFLRDSMWDDRYGGFYQIRSREGGYSECRGWGEEKRTLGNACAIFALASLYGATHDRAVLSLAQEAFEWLEVHAYDSDYRGYHQFLTRQGEPFDDTSQYRSVAADIREVGLKDINSSVHLMEAYTELLRVWDKEALRDRLSSLLELIRDTMVTKNGYLQLFFNRDWTPVTFRAASEATRTLNYGLDHVSFGDDIQTAFLMLDASCALELQNDGSTLQVAKHLVDHAIENAFDGNFGGFFDAGYYGDGFERCSIIKNTKTWWVQAEALNTLLIFSQIFPEIPRYQDLFERQWKYIDKFMIDHRNGDWYERGIDTDPSVRHSPKSHMWKCTYHAGRALMNCVALTGDDEHSSQAVSKQRHGLNKVVNHWRKTKVVLRKQGIVAADASL